MYAPFLSLLLLTLPSLNAAVIGSSKPAESVTTARISTLPERDRLAWIAYLERSQTQRRTDQAMLAAERPAGGTEPPLPKESAAARSMPLDRPAAWYGTPEARHIADVIVSFQTPAGGWSKNLDMTGPPRIKGQSYAPDNLSKHPGDADFDTPHNPHWNYVGTLDNDATTTELQFLAFVSHAAPGSAGDAYRSSFLRGVRYLLEAQFPNGGWPQVWPLEGGYHDAITFNDNALTDTVELLTSVARGTGNFDFAPSQVREQAAASVTRSLQCILATQVVAHGQRTAWAQQYDALTLVPVAGRNYEPAALSSGESADILIYLMQLPHPSAETIAAIYAGTEWLKAVAIYGQRWTGGRDTPGGRQLATVAGAGPIWARFYSIETGRPIFGDRDKTIHDTVAELSYERRNGYAWYGSGPEKALDAYASWKSSTARSGVHRNGTASSR